MVSVCPSALLGGMALGTLGSVGQAPWFGGIMPGAIRARLSTTLPAQTLANALPMHNARVACPSWVARSVLLMRAGYDNKSSALAMDSLVVELGTARAGAGTAFTSASPKRLKTAMLLVESGPGGPGLFSGGVWL